MAPAGAPPPPPPASLFKGSDGTGPISFRIYGLELQLRSRYLFDLRVANECSTTSTAVKARIKLNGQNRFRFSAPGVTIIGRLHRPGSSARYTASGTVSIDTGSCDSDRLAFTAKEE